MDHSESIRLMAAEKYLLGELAPELREQFEEHFFDCQECALDVRAGAALVEHSKVVLSEPVAVSPASLPVPARVKPDWPGLPSAREHSSREPLHFLHFRLVEPIRKTRMVADDSSGLIRRGPVDLCSGSESGARRVHAGGTRQNGHQREFRPRSLFD